MAANSRARRRRAPRAQIEVQRRCRGWAPPARELQRWLRAALGRRTGGSEVAVMLVGAVRSRRLNRDYRGEDHATNVLSFPAIRLPGLAGLRGDLVICPQVLRREARAQGKRVRDHWAHLFVHGLLHLAGLDHQRTEDAARMERREIRVLGSLGIANPYRLAGGRQERAHGRS